MAQRNHDIRSKLIYALKSGDEKNLLALPVPFRK